MGAKLAKNTRELYMCRVFYLCLVLSFTSYSQTNENCAELAELAWLGGHWVSEGEKRDTLEFWRKISDDTFEGVGKVLNKEGQLTSQESLRLVQMGGNIFYLAKVKHNALPIAFKAAQCSSAAVTFENAEHDFPNTLTYSLKTNQLHVTVKGKDGDGFALIFKRHEEQ